MKKIVLCLALLAVLIFTVPAYAAEASTDPHAKTKREMIKKSIEDYKGSCPCPYSQNKDGLYCRGASAYTKPWSPNPPMCYFRDINDEMVEAYLKEKGEKIPEKKKPKAAPATPKKGS
jgi:hypothetical protein